MKNSLTVRHLVCLTPRHTPKAIDVASRCGLRVLDKTESPSVKIARTPGRIEVRPAKRAQSVFRPATETSASG